MTVDTLRTPCEARLVLTVAIEARYIELANVIGFLCHLFPGDILCLVDDSELIFILVFHGRVERHLRINT